MLKINNLHKEYPGGDVALQGINLELEKGEITAVIGPSGAGKSTLIRCINRLVESTAGEIILEGQDINQLNKKELKNKRRKMGMIFQEYALVERLTVMEMFYREDLVIYLFGEPGCVNFLKKILIRLINF